jgi:CBS domain containing-hemolysin-like protein
MVELAKKEGFVSPGERRMTNSILELKRKIN